MFNKKDFLGFVRVASIFSSFFRAGEKIISKLIATHFCVLKMFVHPDGASTMVPVILPVKNVRHGPTQV